jgi:hypothetical protein
LPENNALIQQRSGDINAIDIALFLDPNGLLNAFESFGILVFLLVIASFHVIDQ